MAFIETISPKDAIGDVREMYTEDEKTHGYIPNYAKLFSHRPQVMGAWGNLLGSIRSNLDTRRYELVTIATARGLRNSYCMLAHSNVLLKNDYFQSEELEAIAIDYTKADITPTEVAIMAFAEKIAVDASSIVADDVQKLRDVGLSDTEIFDVAATEAVRCFFSKLVDSLGGQPDAIYQGFDESLRKSLTVGREISTEALEHLE